MYGLRPLQAVVLAVVAALLAGTICYGATLPAQDVPPLLTDQDGRIIWVSSRRVAEEGPELLRRLADRHRFEVGWLLEALADPGAITSTLPGRDDCLQYLEVAGLTGGTLDFDSHVLSGGVILSGTVVDAAEGLAGGSPQTALLLAVDRWLKGPVNLTGGERAYVRYPTGQMEIAGVSVCRPWAEELPPPPVAGAPVLAMFYREPLAYTAVGDPVFYAGQTLVYDGRQGGLPTLMASDALLRGSFDGLVDATVAELVERADRVLASPDEFRPPEEQPAAPLPPASREGPSAERPVRQPDPPDPCLRTEECLVTPLILAAGPFEALTSSINRSTTLFDIDADRRPERTAWLGGDADDAFLWMDLNGDGAVDGAHEFVGAPGTDPRPEPTAIESSFEIFALYDEPHHGGNGDGKIDGGDRIWGRLFTWADRDRDGISTPDEIAPVGAKVVYFEVAYELADDWDGSLNRILGRGLSWVRGLRRELRPREVSERGLRFR